MLVAGEASGDHHGAELVRALLRARPGAELFGLGGQEMAKAGMRLDLDLAEKSVIGLVEVLKHLFFFWRAFRLATDLLERERPDVLVLIDYPGFNLRLAKHAKRLGIRMVYYISPQVWAWKASRVPTMARLLDKMLVTFPFEKAIYEQAGLPCTFVGNPLVDSVKPKGSFLKPKAGERRVGLLPGSRAQEVKALLPVMLKAADVLAATRPDLRFVVVKAPALPWAHFAAAQGPRVQVIESKTQGQAYALRKSCDVAMVASGTATLETAMLGVPFVIVYKLNALTYAIGKRLVKIHSIGLANVVAGRRVVPEFLQRLDPVEIAGALGQLLDDPRAAGAQRKALAPGLRSLGRPGVAQRAAQEVLKVADA